MKTKINELLGACNSASNLLAYQFLQSQEGMQAEESIAYIIDHYLDNHEEGIDEILIDFGSDKCQIIFKLERAVLYNQTGIDTYFSFTLSQDQMTVDSRDYLVEEQGRNWGPIGQYKKEDLCPDLDSLYNGLAKRVAQMVGNQAPKLD